MAVAEFLPPLVWHQVVVASCTAFHIDPWAAEEDNEAFVVQNVHEDSAASADTALAFAPRVTEFSHQVVVPFADLLVLPRVFVVAHKAIAEQESVAAVAVAVAAKHDMETAVIVHFRE